VNINPNYYPVPADATTPSTSANSLDGTSGDTFLQLLSTQLQNQSPLDPVDPNQFVSQLVQFNTLDQIISIRQLLQQLTGTSGTNGSTGSTPTTQGGH
jgi:flagellar basal-body rod modification protein FlgD